MTTHRILPSRNPDHGLFGTLTTCPQRERRSVEVWVLASTLIAKAIRANSEDTMIGIRDFLDSRMGRHFADDVVGHMIGCNIDSETAIRSSIRTWQDWRISRQTECDEGIPAGLPYLIAGCSTSLSRPLWPRATDQPRHSIPRQEAKMPKLTDTQTIVLSRAATRPGNLAMPLPEGLHGAAAQKAVTAMITRGWLEEVEANLRRGEPMWRETGDGHGATLIATEAGLQAIGIEPVVASAVASARKAKPKPEAAQASDNAATPKPVAIRAGTKQAQIIEMLQRPEGASIAELVKVTRWQPHTLRGAISGALKKKLGLMITTVKEDDRGAVYRIG